MAPSGLRDRKMVMRDWLLWQGTLGAGKPYSRRVRATGPIAYFPLWESSGTDILDQIDPNQNGTYTGVTLGQTGIGDGKTCPLFDGANDYGDINTATLIAAFNAAEGSAMAWIKVSGAGVWTDGQQRYILNLKADANNQLFLRKLGGANDDKLSWVYEANNTIETVISGSLSTTAWQMMMLTWSKTGDAVKAYLYEAGSGGQVGSTQTGLGTWSGALVLLMIGAQTTVPDNPSDGYLAHVTIWDSALDVTTIAALAVV